MLLIPKMIKLLVILFQLFAQKDIFKHIKKKHGQDMATIVRSFKQIKAKYMKTVLDIKNAIKRKCYTEFCKCKLINSVL